MRTGRSERPRTGARWEAEARCKEEERQADAKRREEGREAEAKRRQEEREAEAKKKRDEQEAKDKLAETELDINGLVLLKKTLAGTGNQFGGEITGTVVNRTGKKLKYAQITFNLYDASVLKSACSATSTDLSRGSVELQGFFTWHRLQNLQVLRTIGLRTLLR